MLKPHHVLLCVSLLQDGGVEGSRTDVAVKDGGTARPPNIAEGIQWPADLQPLATLDGPAVLAAHAALQRVLSRYPKEYAKSCTYSAKGMEVIVGEERGTYFVRINPRPDKCGWAPGTVLGFDVFELYAVSPEGKVLARYPAMP
ncbi:hypothetical protein COCOR_07101 [Corallococcus coralloides DSM 2259]|uniref:Uncharacterized protein n=1 Tax=Corallococcus coralloides (strain ATCC 25202 / DSM 2259 / NBRC 100086 / M2) TaxID=1144275 RepID=H8MH68_CORCM|nr:hypothetical protein [Corallococcus coralloides]AFE07327.1 hypothetical protein COCOR_07101 [Corallococcus coralloides DSM 2259]